MIIYLYTHSSIVPGNQGCQSNPPEDQILVRKNCIAAWNVNQDYKLPLSMNENEKAEN